MIIESEIVYYKMLTTFRMKPDEVDELDAVLLESLLEIDSLVREKELKEMEATKYA